MQKILGLPHDSEKADFSHGVYICYSSSLRHPRWEEQPCARCWRGRKRGLLLKTTQIFFPTRIEEEAGLMTDQRGIQFSWFPTLNTIWFHQTTKEKKQQAKHSSNFCLRDCCKFLFRDCLPQKLLSGGRHLFFTVLVKRHQAAGHFYSLNLFSSHADR